jgi:hypothetical protein
MTTRIFHPVFSVRWRNFALSWRLLRCAEHLGYPNITRGLKTLAVAITDIAGPSQWGMRDEVWDVPNEAKAALDYLFTVSFYCSRYTFTPDTPLSPGRISRRISPPPLPLTFLSTHKYNDVRRPTPCLCCLYRGTPKVCNELDLTLIFQSPCMNFIFRWFFCNVYLYH